MDRDTRPVPAAGAAARIATLPLADWERRFGVRAGITTRGAPEDPADFDLRLVDGDPGVAARWDRLRRQLGMEGVVAARQVHGLGVQWHASGPRGVTVLEGLDGHATGTPGTLLAVTAADCIPVYIIDPVTRSVALVHAGWRGTAGRIVEAGIRALVEGANVSVENIVVHCGVGICGECYEVGPEVLTACGGPDVDTSNRLLDLRSAIRQQAIAARVAEVSTSPHCSAHERDRFFSHRASRGGPGRMAAYIGYPATAGLPAGGGA